MKGTDMKSAEPNGANLTGAEPRDAGTARAAQRSASRPLSFAARFVRKRAAAASAAYLLLVLLVTLTAGWIAPYGTDEQDLTAALDGPSGAHWLGTGELGRDVLSRLMHGGQVTLLGVLITLAVYLTLGVPAGMVAGYRGGWFDRLVLKTADLISAVPVIIVLLVVLSVFTNDESAAMAANGILGAPLLARVVRSATLGVKEELYVRAAIAGGIRDRVIIRRHVLPRVAGVILVQASVYGAYAVLLETGLGFLGLGTTEASWGSMIAEASKNIGTDPWLLVPSGFMIISFILALGLLSDGMRDTLAERYAPPADKPPSRRRAARQSLLQVPRTSVSALAAPTEDALLSVRGLTVALPIDGTPTEVIRDVSFDLRAGEVLGIVGETGCGKTVTATSVLGMLPAGGEITAGTIRFEGNDLAQADAASLRRVRGRRIGWISQDPVSGLDPSFTAGAQVAEVVRLHTGCTRKEARQRALELFELVRLPDPARVAAGHPHQLSGGMAQRVGIAAALAGHPALVIADEPTTALDVTVQAEILDLLRELRKTGTAVLLITHDWGVLADLCDRAVVMYAGEVVEEAEVTALVTAPAHPYTAGLLSSDPHHAVPGEPLPAVEGAVPPPPEWPVGCHFQNRCPRVTDACREKPVVISRLAALERSARCIRPVELIGETVHD
ncbi:dipeptide/oligopeptide/nickel ABC transporter permease/ATP-binding protein [Streptomyces sp. SID13726]|uniref:dipeptide/oligopeptide/nickel ABC transporter permease/ATP-binding protein n=1 Tax=Streptomyces sp. SID13726 TaxID=2706058 RepID=UPI0013B74481|nr:dipeptide/oligopeptide/nickel ABC transporter permease/ATP-binding protein [Streptomyces sp. SID13726]NEB03531.1 dipeptide/oligopeptide/nickel ABC transporter permease/ATP-binding protein [Streptomyces sp. SID13726]